MPPTPPEDPAAATPPPGVPPQQPHWQGPAGERPREARGVAFFIAILLGILLVASAGLNVLLLLLSVGSIAGSGIGDPAAGVYDEVHVAGDRASQKKVLQIAVRGAILEGSNPVMGAAGGTVTQVQNALRQAHREGVDGILLYIDSPGGGVTDSDRIYQMLRRYRIDHPDVPVAALFGDMAASGGYYVAVAAEHVISRRTSICGSIGVIMSAWNFAELADKWGIEQVAIKSDRTPYKDMLSPTRALAPAERAMLTGIVDELYDQFVSVVDEGRPIDREAVLRAATGGIYTATQALGLGLVDEIGDYEAALRWFEARLGSSVRLVERRRRPGFAELLFGGRGTAGEGDALPGAAFAIERLLTSSTGPRFLYYWQGGR